MIDSLADGLVDHDDLLVTQELREIDDGLLLLNTRREEIRKVLGHDLDPDVIASRLIGRVHDLRAFLDSQGVADQRKDLFAFCKRITADAFTKEIVIETDLAGMAQKETPPGLPAGLCNLTLAEGGPCIIAQPAIDVLQATLLFRAA